MNNATTILEQLELNARERAEGTALRWPDRTGVRSMSWGELYGRVKTTAAGLRAAGLKEGDRAAIVMRNSPELLIAEFGTIAAGGAAVSIDPAHPAFIMRNSLAAAALSFRFKIAGDDELLGWMERAGIADTDLVIHGGPLRRKPACPAVSLDELSSGDGGAGLSAPAGSPAAVCKLAFTAGRTARPKAAALSQAAMLAAGGGLASALELRPGDKYLSLSHLSSSWALQEFLACARAGSVFSIFDWAPSPAAMTRAVELLSPDIIRMSRDVLLGHFMGRFDLAGVTRVPRAGLDRVFSLPARKKNIPGGAPLRLLLSTGTISAESASSLAGAGCQVLHSYGLTEACGFVSLGPAAAPGLGKALEGMSVQPAGDGELVVRGPALMNGYQGDPGLSEPALRDGSLFTGDIGRTAADGTFVFEGSRLPEERAGAAAPSGRIAGLLMKDELVMRAVVVGGERAGPRYPVAVVIPDMPEVIRWFSARGASFRPGAGPLKMPDMRRDLERRLRDTLSPIPVENQPKEFVFLEKHPEITRPELCPDYRLREPVFSPRYRRLLQEIYIKTLAKASLPEGREPVFLNVELDNPRPYVSSEGGGPRVEVRLERTVTTGIPSLLGSLEAAGFAPDYILARFRLSENYRQQVQSLARTLVKRPGRVIAASCFGITLPFLLKTLREVKRLAPDKKIVLGGCGPNGASRRIIELMPFVDVVVNGEGEKTLPLVLEALLAGRDVSGIRGISCRSPAGSIVSTLPERLRGLDDLPRPSYGPIDTRDYAAFAVSTMRGCPNSCKYCGNRYMFGAHVELRSLDRVIEEMRTIYREKQVSNFFVIDEIFTLFKPRALEFCSKIEKAFGGRIAWVCYSTVDNLEEEMMAAMAASGCVSINIGVESGAERVLRRNKRTQGSYTPGEALEKIALARKYFANVTVFLMVGFPEETLVDFLATLRLSRRITRFGYGYVKLFWLKAIPLTPVFEENRGRLQSPSGRYHWPLRYVEWAGDLARLDPLLAPWALVVPTPHFYIKDLLFTSFALKLDGRRPLANAAKRVINRIINKFFDASDFLTRSTAGSRDTQ